MKSKINRAKRCNRPNLKACLAGSFIFVVGLALAACGGGGAGGDTSGGDTPLSEKTGVFLDAVVSGAQFDTSSGISGQTTTEGEFQYIEGDLVTFSFGEINLPPVQGGDIVTPLQMVGTGEVNDQSVINILRLLQSLDTDENPDNGIQVFPADSFPSDGNFQVDFGQTEAEFEAAMNAFLETLPGSPQLVATDGAQSHFQNSLLQQLSGTYNGSYAGDGAGTFRITIDFQGGITGSITDNAFLQGDKTVSVFGQLESNGNFTFRSTDGNKILTGSLAFSGNLEGRWRSDSSNNTGTFTGNKNTSQFSFEQGAIPGTYDLVEEGSGQKRVYSFGQNFNGTVKIGDELFSNQINWYIGSQEGQLMIVNRRARINGIKFLDDRITLVDGSVQVGKVTIESDEDRNASYETTVTASWTKRP